MLLLLLLLLLLKMMALNRKYPLITPLKSSLPASRALFYCICTRLLQLQLRHAGRDWHAATRHARHHRRRERGATAASGTLVQLRHRFKKLTHP